MAKLESMLPVFMMLLLGMNAIMLAITYLPMNEQGTATYGDDSNFGFNNNALVNLKKSLSAINTDANSLTGLQNNVTGSAEDSARENPYSIWNLIWGAAIIAGSAIAFTQSGVLGAAATGAAIGLFGFFWKYFSYLIFGYLFWIDVFLNPAWGGFFLYLNLGIKAMFFIITIMGLLAILLPLFTSWRK